MARVEITSKGGTDGTVHLDGHDISRAVRGVIVDVHVESGRPQVTLELGVYEIERLDLEEAEVRITTATRDALVKLGWTPPNRLVAVRELHCVRSGTGGIWDTDPVAICNECSTPYPCDTLRILDGQNGDTDAH